MGYQVAVNGFGPVGRSYLRCLLERGLADSGRRESGDDVDVRVVAINHPPTGADARDAAGIAGPLTVDGPFTADGPFTVDGGGLVIGGRRIPVLREPDPAALPWEDLGVDLVIDTLDTLDTGHAVGRPDGRDDAALHLKAGAGRVLIAGPGTAGTDTIIVPAVNGAGYDPVAHRVVAAGCPATACAALMTRVLHDAFGVLRGHLTVLRARPEGPSAITPSAAETVRALGRLLPDLAGRVDGLTLDVPAGSASLVGLTCELVEPVGPGEVHAAFSTAARFTLPGLLHYRRQPVAPADIVGTGASCVVDSGLTRTDDRLATVFGWYDNGWGFANRLVDFTELFAGGR